MHLPPVDTNDLRAPSPTPVARVNGGGGEGLGEGVELFEQVSVFVVYMDALCNVLFIVYLKHCLDI